MRASIVRPKQTPKSTHDKLLDSGWPYETRYFAGFAAHT